jgi:hypothetical protein
MRKFVIPVLLAVVAALIGYLGVTAVAQGDDKPKSASNHVVTGEYHQTDGPKNMDFVAVITGGKIQVDMTMGKDEGDSNLHGVYWIGSFDTSNVSDTFDVTSKTSDKDKNQLGGSLLGSQSSEKQFTYKNGVLSFEFVMKSAGIKTTVYLSK